MPKITYSQTNFTAGTLTPKLYGRGDIARYSNGLKTLHNCINLLHGGARRRPGLKYQGPTKDNGEARLIPFVLTGGNCYWLEFGDLYMRVWSESGQVMDGASPYELVTPYTAEMLADMDYAQSGENMILFHEDVYPQRLFYTAADDWLIEDFPFSQEPVAELAATPPYPCTPSADSPVGKAITLTLGAVGTSGGGGVYAGNGSAGGGTVTSGGGGSGVWAASAVGALVKINGGYCRITSVGSSSSVCNAVILRELNAVVQAEVDSWELLESMLQPDVGYPKTGTFYEQRLCMAGFGIFPNHVVGSVTGNIADFTPGTDDSDGFIFELSADQMSGVEFLTSSRALVGMGFGGEFTVQGGIEKPLTPTNVQVRKRSNVGCARVRPVKIGREEIFAQRGGRKLYSFSYNVANDEFESEDITRMADHVVEPVVVDMCWQQEPDRTLWIVLQDGTFAHMTMERTEQVVGMATHSTENGVVESVACIPTSTGDSTMMIVRRVVDGNTVRYVERLTDDLYLDSALTFTNDPAESTFTGLDHLEGEEVDVYGDGLYKGRFTVTSGEVTIPVAAEVVQIGLPISGEISLLNADMIPGMGSQAGSSIAVSEVIVKVLETADLKIDGGTVGFRKLNTQILDSGIVARTGSFKIERLAIGDGQSSATITYDKPLPFHVLNITRKLTIND